ncbi:hypothetical protein [Heyndrickxia camelliae]|uniref:Uncharacterized protein n=1 Tax=Heyndrickxia camelliae TaxID=1707093 RepID=A0A2N3LDF9_9BACI|nr:hypothetical protein [Heyndrickxia camelliae]PKR82577.1 hypothetical protein CWO92_23630 [Heyndrickxia camelliae]
MGYSKMEQETVLTFDYERNVWMAYSTVPKHIRKLMAIGNMEILESEDDKPIAIKGILTDKQVSMKKPRVYTEKQREELQQRGKILASKKV